MIQYKNKSHICQICSHDSGSFRGFANHIIHNHPISWEEYKEKYWKFSEKDLNKDNFFQCKICFNISKSHKGFAYHISHSHGSSQEQYLIEYEKIKNKCLNCSNKTKYISLRNGFNQYCKECLLKSKHPTQKLYWELKKGIKNELEIEKQMKIWKKENGPMFIEYYLKRNGDDLEDAQKQLFEYHKTHRNVVNHNKRNNFSKISQKLFKRIYKELPDEIKNYKIYFATKKDQILLKESEMEKKENYEYLIYCRFTNHWKKLKKSGFQLDFFIKELMLNIEFDGTYWHNEKEDKIRDEILKEIYSQIKIIRIKEEEFDLEKDTKFCLNEINKLYIRRKNAKA